MNGKFVELGKIDIDENFQTRKVDPQWVKHLEEQIELGNKLRPLLIAEYGKQIILIGGNHTFEAYKKAFGTNWQTTKVYCNIIPACENSNDMMRAAIDDNRTHGKPLTEQERNALYYKLTREWRWSIKEAKEAIGITDKRASSYEDKIGLITMRPEKKAAESEETMRLERAESLEETEGKKRAIETEETIIHERTNELQETIGRECAEVIEETNPRERASQPIPKLLIFHIKMVKQYLPKEWAESNEAFDRFIVTLSIESRGAENED